MAEIRVLIEAHAYDSSGLHDEYFKYDPGYGIAGPEVMKPLAFVRGTSIAISYDEETTLGDIEDRIRKYIWEKDSDIVQHYARFLFVVGNRRYRIEDTTRQFEFVKRKYLDVDSIGQISVCFLVSHCAGEVEPKQGPLRYFVRSHEMGSHHEPHIHVKDVQHRYNASVRISDGEVIAGKLPKEYAKMAKQQILSQQNYYLECWNTKTDGLSVDINYDLGLISY